MAGSLADTFTYHQSLDACIIELTCSLLGLCLCICCIDRTAFHALALVGMMAEGHSKSHIFSVLKGKESWLTKYIFPPLPLQEHSVHAMDIVDHLDDAVLDVAKWLLRAGVPVDGTDLAGHTPLHYAAANGMVRT